ncbi:fluoride efflux transporter CrcB [Vineibacter terrae]|uniref:Fluoride-specific ion channel FluC n=1 Tax=Vineibacter terrae TaxID=2586908 RepID=A0A5C8PWE4_9HYPH|nr:fluoride efflux transporter CrcB [Vineibacter terrae]TXL82200.1 fluoride efflux transporter CrcB [Vineibacter terrae]
MDVVGCAFVLIGGFLGGVLRFAISGAVARTVGETFPWGTLVVNVTGDFVIGSLAGMISAVGGIMATAYFRDFAVVGLLGGYTTVSSFALQTLNLVVEGEGRRAWGNVGLSVALGLLAVGTGFWLASQLFG